MLPHGRRDAKFDSKSKLYLLNEVAELYNCNNVLFFEARKGKDLYLWASKIPNGPTIKFYVQNSASIDPLRRRRLTEGSAHDGGTPLYGKLFKRLKAYSLIRLGL